MTSKTKQIAIPVLVAIIVASGFGTAYALTVTLDKGLGCGDKNWGIKEYQNDFSGTAVNFGMDDDCTTTNFTYNSRDNVATIETEIDGINPDEHIAWASILQGEDPFGHSDTDGGALNHNTAFDDDGTPLDADEAFEIKVQWLWSNDVTPENSSSDIYANYLMNLWLENDSDPDTIVVIDLLVDRLENNNGNWAQDAVGSNGNTYYTPFCDINDGKDTYHYGVIVDTNDSRAKDTWHEITPSIDSYIDDAFSATYTQGSCGSSSIPDTRADYIVLDQEQGIELQIFTANHEGKVKGAYSFSELWY